MDQFSESKYQSFTVSRPTFIWNIFDFHQVLYGEQASLAVQFICHTQLYKNYNFQIDGVSQYFGLYSENLSTWFALSSGVFCFCIWPSFIGTILSVIKVYLVVDHCQPRSFLLWVERAGNDGKRELRETTPQATDLKTTLTSQHGGSFFVSSNYSTSIFSLGTPLNI